MKNIVLVGAGGHCRSILSVLKMQKSFNILAIYDHSPRPRERIDGIEVLHIDQISDNDCSLLFPSIGDNQNRYNIIKSLESCSYSFPSIISPQAFVDSSATIGKGCFIGSFAYVGPHAHIGDFSIINTHAILEHESKVGSFVHLAPSSVVCGRTTISDHCFLGANSVVIDNLEIEKNTIIGAGSVVIRSISTMNATYVGNPASSK